MNEQFLQSIAHLPTEDVPAGQVIMRQGERRGQLWILRSGTVEIVKNDTPICTVSDKGAIFGELSCLLRVYQLASVRTTEVSSFHVIENAEAFLSDNTPATFFLAKMLARRLALLDSHFSQLKRDFEKLKSEAEGMKEEGPGTQLFHRFITQAEKSLEAPRAD